MVNYMAIAYISILFYFTQYKMSTKYTQITKKELNLTAKNKGIKEPQKMSTKDLIDAISRYNSKRKSYKTRRKF